MWTIGGYPGLCHPYCCNCCCCLHYNHAILHHCLLPCWRRLRGHVQAAGWPGPELEGGGGNLGALTVGATFKVPGWSSYPVPMDCTNLTGTLPCTIQKGPVGCGPGGHGEWWHHGSLKQIPQPHLQQLWSRQGGVCEETPPNPPRWDPTVQELVLLCGLQPAGLAADLPGSGPQLPALLTPTLGLVAHFGTWLKLKALMFSLE